MTDLPGILRIASKEAAMKKNHRKAKILGEIAVNDNRLYDPSVVLVAGAAITF